MQQHLMQMQPMNMMAAYYPNNVTTDHIQQYLDENKSLILKIVESQNAGKITECQENQARLQRNLMYLAAIADSQPPPTAVHSQAGSHYLQHQQGQQMTQQSMMPARSSMMYTQQQFAAQQALNSQLGMTSAGLHLLQSEASGSLGGFPDYRGKQGSDGGETLYLKSADDNGN